MTDYAPRTPSGARALAHLARVGIEPITGAPRPGPRPGGADLAPWSFTPRRVPGPYRPRMLARLALALAPRTWRLG